MAGQRQGILHHYAPRLTAFEHIPSSSHTSTPNLVLFVGGLFDGFGTVPYVSSISDALPPTWSIAQALLSSSYKGWGFSSLQRDAREIAQCVAYFQTIKTGLIILMGHSTGCQDVMEYLTKPSSIDRPPIDGGILQGPVSDREMIVSSIGQEVYEKSCSLAQTMVDEGRAGEILPADVINHFFTCPVSAYRWLSMASPKHDGDDDYFSSDLTNRQLQKTFGNLPARASVCILFSGKDQYVPAGIDQQALLRRWIEITEKGEGRIDQRHSGIIEGASHNLEGDPPEVINALVKRILGFVGGLTTPSNL